MLAFVYSSTTYRLPPKKREINVKGNLIDLGKVRAQFTRSLISSF